MQFILSVVLEKTARFAATVDVVLEDCNSYLLKTNNWVLNIFGQYLGKRMLKVHY